MDETQQLQDIVRRMEAVELKTKSIQPTAFLNQFSVDPASSGFLQDFIAIPYTTTQPTYTPNKDGYRVIYFDGANYHLYIYANSGWRSTPLGGGGTTFDATHGTTTRGGSDASGNQVIAHGISGTPTMIEFSALWAAGTPILLTSFGRYDGTAMSNINSRTYVGTGGAAGNDTTNIIVITDGTGNAQFATVTMDATNMTLAWTRVGTLGGTVYILWKAEK